jgi:tetratricopeptide (TPR) repeat protein
MVPIVPVVVRRSFIALGLLGAFVLPVPAGNAQPAPAQAQASCSPPPAKAVSVQGTVEARRAGASQWQPVKLNDTFCAGDAIRVGDKSRADVALLNQSVLRINANSAITVEAPKEERTGVIALVQGAAHFFARGPRSLEVQTPFTIAGVRGTEFYIGLESDQALMTVFEGTVVAQNAAGSLSLTDGQSAVAASGKAPVLTVVAKPRDAVQWALYYPPVIYFRPDEFPAGSDWRGAVRRSSDAYMAGDLRQAFEPMQSVPPDVSDARFFAYRAHLLLAVGRVDDARADIARAQKIAPNDANALALQSIIAVVQGDKAGARDAAQRAVAAAPNSATAHIALSYAQQAAFDLPGARASLQKAVELDPQNALAFARLAEIESSFGESGRALAAARRATELQPNLSRTQTVLGFAYLTQIRTDEARGAFERAITLDQGDPLPRLGLGLAKIRDGNLDEGSRDIEVAASLDSSNAIVRSYLGKAYYEEKLYPRDEREYKVAKQLDPNDPTPWFYDAIEKQTTNRPVEALQDIEKAIELNDNRAIYRSRLLLDSDLAARSASLARIYSDLGFQELALVEGWKSVNTDPSNFSAHRFLADSYAVLPRHEIARVSELLQSQMLQPLNSTPIQPQLAESNLFLISSGGPGVASFNEFNPLFSRNGANVQAGGLVGNNGTSAAEAIVSGIYKNFSYSFGGFTYRTDGFRENADQKDDIANLFLQYEFSPQTSAQFEYRYRHTTTGDLQLNFFADDVLPNLRNRAETENYRLGLRHMFSPGSVLLVSLAHQSRDTHARDVTPDVLSVDIREPNLRGNGAEIQHLWRAAAFNLTSGIGYFDINREQITDLTFEPPLDFLSSSDRANLDAKHTNVYVYSYINTVPNVTFTLGASGDFFRTPNTTSSESKNQFNPKFGVTWNVLPRTTVRAAAFRTFKRTLLTNQTLEPTQVAGFNQFFDDQESTDAWVYGAAVDHKFTRTVFGGLEYTRRDLDVPIPVLNAETGESFLARRDWSEDVARAYLFWTPHPWWALSAEYRYERFVRTEDSSFGFKDETTHRVPLGLRFFHPSGFSFGFTGTYYHQDGDFQARGTACCVAGTSSFWIADAGLSYRLPKRYGFVTIGATNLFDKQFLFQETDFNNFTIQPARSYFARLTLAFP